MPNPGEIIAGIEWFETPLGMDCQCARCGSSANHLDCYNCGGEGFVEVEEWVDAHDYVKERCDMCEGTGGSWHCISGPEYCCDNPMQGREGIESSALNASAWND